MQNVSELILPDEVIEAVQCNMFNIYPVAHIDQGIELLTDLPATEIHRLVMNKLCENSQKMKEFHS